MNKENQLDNFLSNTNNLMNKNQELEYGTNIFDNTEAKRSSKVLKISSEYNSREVLASIKTEDFPKLFIFNIDYDSSRENEFGYCKIIKALQAQLISFSKLRPLILQLTSNDEKSTKIFYKLDNAEQFIEIDPNKHHNDIQCPKEFSSLLLYTMSNKLEVLNFENIENILQSKDDSLITVRYLRTLDLPEDIIKNIILKCAEKSLNVLLAALDISFECKEDIIVDSNAAKYLSEILNTSTNQSILNSAILSENNEVINFLINHCAHLLQKLPISHQIEVSGKAQKNGDILCNLVMLCNFPFPQNLNVQDDKLVKLREDVVKIHNSIIAGNSDNLLNFIDHYKDMKVVYNFDNNSLLYQAFKYGRKTRSWDCYAKLKIYGFRPTNDEVFEKPCQNSSEFDNHINDKDRVAIIKAKLDYSHANPKITVTRLTSISTIHNQQKYTDHELMKHHEKIEQWFTEIWDAEYPNFSDEKSTKTFTYGRKLLEVVSSSKNLKIIFVFDSEFVKNVDPGTGQKTLGITYPTHGLIIIGAKHDGDEKREDTIRGTISHELGHYGMYLIYNNTEKPYFEVDSKSCEKFKKIIDEYLKKKDEMDNYRTEYGIIITSVFDFYSKENFEKELIVRAPEMLAYFCKSPENFKNLYKKNYELFDFYINIVLPEMARFSFEDQEDIEMLNKYSGFLQAISSSKYEFSTDKFVMKSIENFRLVVIVSNIPKLAQHLPRFTKEGL